MIGWILKWITPAWFRMWPLVAGAFGVLALYAKGRQDQKTKQQNKDLKQDLETLKRVQNVKTNTDVNASLDRLRRNGDLRD
jgi:hypothetical protein